MTTQEFIEKHNIKQKTEWIKYRPDGLMSLDMDHWEITLIGPESEHTVFYSTGLGYRKRSRMPMNRKFLTLESYNKLKKGLKPYDADRYDFPYEIPVEPKTEGILCSLHSDLQIFIEYDFQEYCDNLGYNSDSIKHLQEYDKGWKISALFKDWLMKNNIYDDFMQIEDDNY